MFLLFLSAGKQPICVLQDVYQEELVQCVLGSKPDGVYLAAAIFEDDRSTGHLFALEDIYRPCTGSCSIHYISLVHWCFCEKVAIAVFQ